LWLLDDAKQTEETRQDAIAYAAEGIAWITALGVATATDASWIRQNMLAILAQAGSLQLRLPVSLI
jgi:phage gp46-like protein